MEISVDPSVFARKDLIQDHHIMKVFNACIMPLINSVEHIVTMNRYMEFIETNGTYKLAMVTDITIGMLTRLLSEWVYREPYEGMYYVGNRMEATAEFAENVLGRFYEKAEIDRLISTKERHFIHQNGERQLVVTTYSSYYRTERRHIVDNTYSTSSNSWERVGVDTREYGDYSEKTVIALMKKFAQEGKKNVYVLLHTGKEGGNSSFSLKWNIEVLYGKIE